MSKYGGFADVYDLFIDNDLYGTWVNNMETIFAREGVSPGLVLDLACGTGNMSLRLARKGCDMIGLDLSAEMLSVAKRKAEEEGLNILFICQDMTEFELYGTVDAVVCVYDSINYLIEPEDVLKTFRLVNNYLNPGGLFIFDLNTEYKFREVLADNTFAQAEENAAYVWENFYDEDSAVNEYAADFFVLDKQAGLYRRFEEQHYERAYTVEEIKNLVKQAGLEFVNVYDAEDLGAPRPDSERLIFAAREKGKK